MCGLSAMSLYAMQTAEVEQKKKAVTAMKEYEASQKEKNARGPWRDVKSEKTLELLEKIAKDQEALAIKQAETEKTLEMLKEMVAISAFAETQTQSFSGSVRALLTLVYNAEPKSEEAAEYKRLIQQDYKNFKEKLTQQFEKDK